MKYVFLAIAGVFLALIIHEQIVIARIKEEVSPRKWLRWDHGRQNSGYSKMLLAISKRFRFDCYILKFPNGIGIPEHTDPTIEGYEHHRLNIFLNRPCVGTGIVSIDGPHKRWLHDRIHLFRPDLYKHSMTPVEFIWSNDSAYILSIGWLKKQPPHKEL